MFCSQCGFQLNEDAKFCSNCGEAVNIKMRNAKSRQLRCQNCDGVMNVEEDKTVLLCPYCGSKELLIENDNVKIAKIKSQTRKDIEIKKQQTHKAVELGKQQTHKDIELAKQQKDIEIARQKLEEQKTGNEKKKMESVRIYCSFRGLCNLTYFFILINVFHDLTHILDDENFVEMD